MDASRVIYLVYNFLLFQNNFYLTKEHTYMYCIIPFLIMLVFNTMFVRELKFKTKVGSETHKHDMMSVSLSVIKVTTLFIVLTLPQSIANGFFVKILFETEIGTCVLFYLDTVLFSFHSFNFFALFLFNKKFYSEAKSIYMEIRKNSKLNRVSATNTTRSLRNTDAILPAKEAS